MSSAFLQSPLFQSIPGIIHGFGTLTEPVPKIFEPHWPSKPRWKQTHGVSIARVNLASQECGEVDAFYSREKSIPIGIVTADCVPILMAHHSGLAVVAVHAGWRGTKRHILKNIVDTLAQEGEEPQDWVAVIGPAIGPCCYEVSEELFLDFSQEFGRAEGLSEVFSSLRRDRKLDLPAMNAWELKNAGVKQVDVMRVCTLCSHQPKFNSYRRDPKCMRQNSIIMRT